MRRRSATVHQHNVVFVETLARTASRALATDKIGTALAQSMLSLALNLGSEKLQSLIAALDKIAPRASLYREFARRIRAAGTTDVPSPFTEAARA